MGTRKLNARIRPSPRLLVWILIGISGNGARLRLRLRRRLRGFIRRCACSSTRGSRRRRAGSLAGSRGRRVCVALQILGCLRGDLGDVQGDLLLLTATLDVHGHVVRALDRIEDLLAALRIIEHGSVDRRDQIARLETQFTEYLSISAWVGAKAAQFARRAVVRRDRPHDLIEDARILLHELAASQRHEKEDQPARPSAA